MTRREWEAAYPGYQTRYLAYLKDTGADAVPAFDEMTNLAFMSWIRKHDAEFRRARLLQGDYVPMSMMDEFTAYLWGEP